MIIMSKFVDKHIKNVISSIGAFLLFFFVIKLAGLTVDIGIWLVIIMLLLIYFELWDKK